MATSIRLTKPSITSDKSIQSELARLQPGRRAGGISLYDRNRYSRIKQGRNLLKSFGAERRMIRGKPYEETLAYTKEFEKSGDKKAARKAAEKERGKTYKEIRNMESLIESQINDNENILKWGMAKSWQNSFAQGAELLVGPLRLGLQGEEAGMAFQGSCKACRIPRT